MSFIILKVFGVVYLIGVTLILLRFISRIVFSEEFRNLEYFFKSILFIPIWPLSLFSKAGREQLFTGMHFATHREFKSTDGND